MQACSGPYWENIGPRSFLYGPRIVKTSGLYSPSKALPLGQYDIYIILYRFWKKTLLLGVKTGTSFLGKGRCSNVYLAFSWRHLVRYYSVYAVSLTQAINIASRSHVFRHAGSYVDSYLGGAPQKSPVSEGEERRIVVYSPQGDIGRL